MKIRDRMDIPVAVSTPLAFEESYGKHTVLDYCCSDMRTMLPSRHL